MTGLQTGFKRHDLSHDELTIDRVKKKLPGPRAIKRLEDYLFRGYTVESSHGGRALILRLQRFHYYYLSHSGKSSRLCLVNVTNPVGSTKAIKEKDIQNKS